MLKLRWNVAITRRLREVAAQRKRQNLVILKTQTANPKKTVVETIALNVIPARFIL